MNETQRREFLAASGHALFARGYGCGISGGTRDWIEEKVVEKWVRSEER
jgi:hypothetical protein